MSEIAEKKYLIPGSIEEAVAFAKENADDFMYLAGGTDVMVNRFQGNETSSCLIDLSRIEGLSGITFGKESLTIGAMTTLNEIEFNDEIRSSFPILHQAAGEVGSPLIRRTATIGGNILCENRCSFYNQSTQWREAIGYCLKCDGETCIATGGTKACFSKFISDTAPALIVLNASIEIDDINGSRSIPLEEIYTGDGVDPRNLDKTAIIKSISIPLDHEYQGLFKKLRSRESVDFTSLTIAVTLRDDDQIRIAVAGVDPKPVVVTGKNGDDLHLLIKQVHKKSRTVDNDNMSRKHRKHMASLYLNECFETLEL